MNSISLLHTHYIPPDLASQKYVKSAIIVPSLTSYSNFYYFNQSIRFDKVNDFFDSWETLACSSNLKDCSILFSIEDISGFTIDELTELLDKYSNLVMIQLYRLSDTKYFNRISGLTADGVKLISILSERGRILDLSHIPGYHAIKIAEKYDVQVILSHCVCSDILDTTCSRANVISSCEILRLCKKHVYFGIPFIDDMVSPDVRYIDDNGYCYASVEDVVRQFEIFANIIGNASYLCMGADYFNPTLLSIMMDKKIRIIPKLQQVDGFLELKELMRQRGFTNSDICNIFSSNMERLFSSLANTT